MRFLIILKYTIQWTVVYILCCVITTSFQFILFTTPPKTLLNSTHSLLPSQFQKTIHLVAVVYFLEPDRDSENLAWFMWEESLWDLPTLPCPHHFFTINNVSHFRSHCNLEFEIWIFFIAKLWVMHNYLQQLIKPNFCEIGTLSLSAMTKKNI